MILSAQSIRYLCNVPEFLKQPNMLEPFHERTREGGMTFGLGPAGYDIRIRGDHWLWPGRNLLADSLETFAIPNDVMVYVKDKSTWARRFVFVQNTVIEPGWGSQPGERRCVLRLEVTNQSWRVFRLRHGTPIAQCVFHRLDRPTDEPYSGKYSGQGEGQNAIMEGDA